MSAAAFSKMLAILARWLGLGSARTRIGVPCLLLPTFGAILVGVTTCVREDTLVIAALVALLLTEEGIAVCSTSMTCELEGEGV